MDTKQNSNMKKKSTSSKIKKLNQKYQCPCISFFLSMLKNKKRVQRSKTTERGASKPDIVNQSNVKSPVLKMNRKSHVFRIPKIGCDIPFLVKLFTDLSITGSLGMDDRTIMNAVNITSKAKKELDEGKKWNGNIEIAENLQLRLYKTGLILYHKKIRSTEP